MNVYGLTIDSWCDLCIAKFGPDHCRGCQGTSTSESSKPTKFYNPYVEWKEKTMLNKEEKRMIATIIGSLSKKEEMQVLKETFEHLGFHVNCPTDETLQKEPLLEIQKTWIKKIEDADLIIVVPKNLSMTSNGGTDYVITLGESTSYELAIATRFGKPVLWA